MPSALAYLGGPGLEGKPQRARLVQEVKVLIWMSLTQFPDVKTQHSGAFILVIFKDNSGSH